MPNWVYNSLTIVGSPDSVEQVREKLAQPYTTYHNDFIKNEETGKVERKPVEWVHEQPIAFWNIVSPTDLGEYYGDEAKHDLDNFAESFARNMAESNHWYEWNVRNWGCKWDASQVSTEDDYLIGDSLTIGYKFSTPWAAPLPAIEKFAAQHPELTICLEFQEEQGWGGEVTWDKGEVIQAEEWDIPDSHEEHILRNGYCWACDGMDEEDWYDDCPREDLTEPVENGSIAA